MEYEQLKEMPRFWAQYSISFFKEADKNKILDLINEKMINNKEFIFECRTAIDGTFSLTLEFADFLFCGFSCSDAIIYLLPEEVLVRIEKIINKYEKFIEDISLSIECYDNCFATRYYMYSDIVGKASEIVRRLKADIYLSVGKDGVYSIKELRKVCMDVADININDFKNQAALKNQLKLEIKKLMKNKTKNYKEIILLRYAEKYVNRLIPKKIMW